MKRNQSKKPLSEIEVIRNALIEFDHDLYALIEKTKNNNYAFIEKVVATIHRYSQNIPSHRVGRRLIRVKLEEKIKELTELYQRINREYEEHTSIIDDVKQMNLPHTPNQNIFIMDINQIADHINQLFEYFTNNVISDYLMSFDTALKGMEHKNRVEPDFTRLYPNHMKKTKNNKNSNSVAGVKVGNKGSLANLRKHHQNRRTRKYASSSNNNNNDRNYGFSSHPTELNLF